MAIMCKHNGSTSIQFRPKLLEAAPAIIGMIILVVLRVDTGSDDMVLQGRHGIQHVGCDHQVGSPHIGWEEAQDAHEGVFEVGHLGDDFVVAEGVEGEVAPSG